MTTLNTTTRPESFPCATQLRPSTSFVELRNTLGSDPAIISPLVGQLTRFISKYRREDNFEIELAMSEALANAIIHGNQQDHDKRVHVSCRCTTDGEVSITVQDEGQGFDIDTVPDPTTPEKRLRSGGRGIYLMKELMDEVCFEQRGSVVHMRKGFAGRSRSDGETK
jgi:serine/threonine-protein kinase RsbW